MNSHQIDIVNLQPHFCPKMFQEWLLGATSAFTTAKRDDVAVQVSLNLNQQI